MSGLAHRERVQLHRLESFIVDELSCHARHWTQDPRSSLALSIARSRALSQADQDRKNRPKPLEVDGDGESRKM